MTMGPGPGGLMPWGLQPRLWVEVLPTFSWKMVKIDVGLVFLSRSTDALALFPACTEHSTWRLHGAHIGTQSTHGHRAHSTHTTHSEHTAHAADGSHMGHTSTHGAHTAHMGHAEHSASGAGLILLHHALTLQRLWVFTDEEFGLGL